MKIVLATDAWHPQINGVVRSLSMTVDQMRRTGHDVEVIDPSRFWTLPCPTYPEIRLALGCGRAVARTLDAIRPDRIHISTEGPIGWATRSWCLKNHRHFTTAFHTRFPDYVSIRTGIPAEWIWKIMRHFHGAAERTFTATATLAEELHAHGLTHTHHWPRGVDLEQFNPSVRPHPALEGLPRPILLNVGRVAVEKNIEAFLGLSVPGAKVVVGGGPAFERLKAKYPEVLFLGPKHGPELAACYAAADVFVFPSRTDTFGLVNIEALACGVPVAAYPVPGPIDILGADSKGLHGGSKAIGALDEDLAKAVTQALRASRKAAAAEALHYSWEACTEQFLSGLASDEIAPLKKAARACIAERSSVRVVRRRTARTPIAGAVAMSSSGLDVYDRTLETTHIWLNEICNDLGPDKQVAWKVLSTVLHKLRDRLTVNLAAHLGAQLPLLIRGVYYDQFEPGHMPSEMRSRDDFVADVAEWLSDTKPVDTEEAIRSVLRVLSRHISEGQVNKVRDALPKSIRQLWVSAEDPTVFSEEPLILSQEVPA